MNSVTTTYHISAAHRVEGHPKCGRLHGHNYKIEVTVTNPKGQLDGMGFIIDFGELKRIVKPVIDQLDHRYMVSEANIKASCPYIEPAKARDEAIELPIWQTSAELLAMLMKDSIQSALAIEGFPHIAVAEVKVWETVKSSATF